MKNLAGIKFGKFTALRSASPKLHKGKRKRKKWVCQCECGALRSIRTDALLSGRRTQCVTCFNRGNSKLHLKIDAWSEARKQQRGLCAMCNRPERMRNKSLARDHDHRTGKPRGLLCSRCNLALGLLEDSEEILLAALKYIHKHK